VKRLFDVSVSLSLLFLLLPVMMVIAVMVRMSSPGPSIYFSNRVGMNNRIFAMPKFRTMKTNAPTVATHLLANPNSYLTSNGSFLRRTSLDELPQLWSVLIGDMSLVGPRPALFSQTDLIEARTLVQVHLLRPGITGLAQVNGRDNISIEQKVELDRQYFLNRSFGLDLKIILSTVIAVFRREGISH
jgi:O-antigen biosynthesis protein WbqP